MGTIRKPTESEFQERATFVAARETSAATSAMSSGLGNFLLLTVMVFVMWTTAFWGPLRLISGLMSADFEKLSQAIVPTAIFSLTLFVFVRRIRSGREERRVEQLGDLVKPTPTKTAERRANFVQDTPTSSSASPATSPIPTSLGYSQKALVSKVIIMGFVSLVLGGLTFGEPGLMMIIAGYFTLRTLVLLVNVPRQQMAFETTAGTIKVADLLGNEKELRWINVIGMGVSRSPFWDILTPLLLGSRKFVELTGASADGGYAKLRISYPMLGVKPGDVLTILTVSADNVRQARDDRPAVMITPATKQASNVAVRPSRAESDLPQMRATFGRKVRAD